MNIYQDGSYLKNNPNWHSEDSPWKAQQIIKMMDKNALDIKNLVEIGCGAGKILESLSKHFHDIHYSGYDISEQAYQLCQPLEKKNLKFYHQDFLKTEAFFDILLAIDVIEHIEDYITFLRQLQTKAHYKIFHIPLEVNLLSILKGSGFKTARLKVGHLHYFTKDIALDMLEYTGYQIVDYFYTKGEIELPPYKLTQKILKLPRQILFQIHQDIAVKTLGGCSLMVLAI